MSQAQIDRANRNAARRVLTCFDYWVRGFHSKRCLLPPAKVRAEIEAAYQRGYEAGHEQQMQMRIRDEKERGDPLDGAGRKFFRPY